MPSSELLAELASCSRSLHGALSSLPPKTTPISTSPSSSPSTAIPLTTLLSYSKSLASTTGAPPSWLLDRPMVNFTAPSPFPHQIQSGALNDLNRRELIKNMKKEEMDRKEGDGEATEGAVEKPIVKKQKTDAAPSTWQVGDAISLSAADVAKLEALKREKAERKEAKRRTKELAKKVALKKSIKKSGGVGMDLSDSD